MSTHTSVQRRDGAGTDGGLRLAAVLAGLGAWSLFPPFVGPLVGLDLDVSTKLEVADHVVPGVLIVACAIFMVSLLRKGRSGSLPSMASACAIALAGMWITATHVPLLLDAGRGVVPWGTAVFHTASGPVILVLALVLVLRELRVPEPD